ncbi:MAG TPA: hypothetical protein VKZ79_24155 [Alphaproteobacteria bacterium]|nr:hypothetical protein [Alphaproteobacteria bacterium]
MRTVSVLVAGFAALAAMSTRAEVAPSISRTVELRQTVDMDCIASATLGIPGVASVTRPAPSEPYVASPDEIKTDKFVYVAPGFGGTLSFAPGFLGDSIYFRHTVDFPDGKPTPEQVTTVRSFMSMVDRTLSRRCNIEGLDAAEEECAAISCPKAR